MTRHMDEGCTALVARLDCVPCCLLPYRDVITNDVTVQAGGLVVEGVGQTIETGGMLVEGGGITVTAGGLASNQPVNVTEQSAAIVPVGVVEASDPDFAHTALDVATTGGATPANFKAMQFAYVHHNVYVCASLLRGKRDGER